MCTKPMYYSNINTLASFIESDMRISFDSQEMLSIFGDNQTESRVFQSIKKKAFNIIPGSLAAVAEFQDFYSMERLSDTSINIQVIL